MNKYAETYLDSIKKYLNNVKWHSGWSVPLAASIGAGTGAVSGLINPEKNEKGEKERVKSIIKGMLKGTAIGGGAGVLGAAVIANPHVGRELERNSNRRIWNNAPLPEKILMSFPNFSGPDGISDAPFMYDLYNPKAKNFFD